jgi:hypothetical protein
VPADTVAAHAPIGDRVTICTANAAAGREWDLVVVAGLQADVWPNLRLRDTVMGAGELADITDGKPPSDDYAERRRAVLDDEARMCALAVSRARRSLVVSAVASLDERPSAFIDLISPPVAEGQGAQGREPMAVPLPLDLRGVIAQARSALVERGGEGPVSEGDADATLLGILAGIGVQGAAPSEWAGVAPRSSDQPLYGLGVRVTLSPSRVEALDTCPLRWALEGAGARRAGGASASLGTLIHGLAEDFPQAGPDELLVHLEERWDSLGLPPGYSTEILHRNAQDMVRRLGLYLERRPLPLGTEIMVDQVVGGPPDAEDREGVRIIGVIDRVEDGAPDGAVRIVDFKTGKQIPSEDATATNSQLGVYQAVVNAGGLSSVDGVPTDARASGADLVYVSGKNATASIRSQSALDQAQDPGWVNDLLERCRDRASSARFTAIVNPGCRSCPVVASCPAKDEGRQVTA